MNIQNINEKYKNVYIYEKNRNMKLCDYGIEIDNITIILCKYDILINYFNYFKHKKEFDKQIDNIPIFYLCDDIEYNVFKDILEILIYEDINVFEKYIKEYDEKMVSNLINTCDFLQTTNLINNFIYNFFTDNIINIYNLSDNIIFKNNLLYEIILENIINSIYIKIQTSGKKLSHRSNRGNEYYTNDKIPEWIYYLMKMMINWSKNMDINSKKRLRKLLNNAIIYIKELDYDNSSTYLHEITNNDENICDIIPFNILC